jgi:hypothetical protein
MCAIAQTTWLASSKRIPTAAADEFGDVVKMPRIVVEDHSGMIWTGANIDILVDGVERAKLKRNVRADFAIPAGRHTIQARTVGAVSRPVNFTAADRESLTFSCVSDGILTKSLVLRQTAQQRHQDRFYREKS